MARQCHGATEEDLPLLCNVTASCKLLYYTSMLGRTKVLSQQSQVDRHDWHASSSELGIYGTYRQD